MSAMASEITSLTIVYSTIYSRRRSKKTSNPHVTGEFPAQRDSKAENVSIWLLHHVLGQQQAQCSLHIKNNHVPFTVSIVLYALLNVFLVESHNHSKWLIARLLLERGRSITSPGFSLCLLSILYTVFCDICIVWAMCDTVAPAAFIPMTCHRWLMVLFPMTKSNWTVTKS